MKGNGVAYVSSDRDREVVAIDVSSPAAGRLIARIALEGNALGMTLDRAESRLYVAQDNADRVSVIDTARNRVVASIDARGPSGMVPRQRYTGAATSAVTISPDGRTLYAVNSGANAIAVVPLTGGGAHRVSGLIPAAYEPHDVTFSADGSWMYIVSGKSVTGRTRAGCRAARAPSPPEPIPAATPPPSPRRARPTSTSSSSSARRW